MIKYLTQRVLIAIPSLLGISVVAFTVLALAPGDPFSELATNPNVPREVQAAPRAKFGLDDPVPIRYLHWLSAMLHGDWGFSFANRVDVSTLILQRLPSTVLVHVPSGIVHLSLSFLRNSRMSPSESNRAAAAAGRIELGFGASGS